MHFQPIDYIPWIGSIIAELIVLAIILRRGLVRRFPVFFTSIAFDVLREIILPIVAFRNPHSYAYSYLYWLSFPVEYVIAFAVILEAMRYSIVNDAKLSRKTLGTLAAFAVLLMAVAALLVLYPDISIKTLPGLAITLERSIELLRCGVLLFIWVFATRLGISWRHHVWGIVFGLGIYSGFSLLVAAMHATTGTLCGDWLARLIPFSYFASTIIWAVYLWQPEPERGPLTLEHLSLIQYALDSYRKVLSTIWRLLDGNPN
jgi:hypothetical protein